MAEFKPEYEKKQRMKDEIKYKLHKKQQKLQESLDIANEIFKKHTEMNQLQEQLKSQYKILGRCTELNRRTGQLCGKDAKIRQIPIPGSDKQEEQVICNDHMKTVLNDHDTEYRRILTESVRQKRKHSDDSGYNDESPQTQKTKFLDDFEVL